MRGHAARTGDQHYRRHQGQPADLARRWQQLQAELTQLDAQLQELVNAVAPTLVALPGVGVDTAGQLLVTAGDNPQRLRVRPPSPTWAELLRSRHPRAAPTATA